MSSRIISGSRTAEDVVRAYYEKRGKDPEPTPPRRVLQPSPRSPIASLDHLVLRDIRCVNAAGNAFEEYPVLHVAKDIERKQNKDRLTFTPYQAITHFEGEGLFHPSAALTYNILAYLFAHKDDAEVAAVLNQYKDYGSGFGYHGVNTVVNWNLGNGRIIHYPHDDDFPSHGGNNNINAQRPHTRLAFQVENFGDILLEEALKRPQFARYIKNLTGLSDPSVLVALGKHFGRPAKVWVPSNPTRANRTASAWVGCDDIDFDLITCDLLGSNDAARGVREP